MSSAKRNAILIRIACLATLLCWLGMNSRDVFNRLELFALDTELRLAPAKRADKTIAILALDERSVHRYGSLPWPPSLMAQVIEAFKMVIESPLEMRLATNCRLRWRYGLRGTPA